MLEELGETRFAIGPWSFVLFDGGGFCASELWVRWHGAIVAMLVAESV